MEAKDFFLEPTRSLSEHSLIELLKKKDQATDAHSARVAALTAEWLAYMKSRREWVDIDEEDLVLAARLHDVGKAQVLVHVLNKNGPLNHEERTHLNLHSSLGYELLKGHHLAEPLALAVLHHHERWDGLGYPLGLKGKEIPFFAQVIAIIDTFDAITSDRPYRKGRSASEALKEIENNAGSQFSAELVASFVKFLHARNT